MGSEQHGTWHFQDEERPSFERTSEGNDQQQQEIEQKTEQKERHERQKSEGGIVVEKGRGGKG